MPKFERVRGDLVPEGSWDTHHHVFDLHKYPLADGRHFTPSSATTQELKEFQERLGFQHTCIAHGLSFGYDLTSLKDYLDYMEGTARGIAVIDHTTISDEELQELHDLGVRSVRIDFFRHKAMGSLEKIADLMRDVANKVAPYKWSIQVQFSNVGWWDQLADTVRSLPAQVLVDHNAFLKGSSWAQQPDADEDTLKQPGLQSICSLVKSGHLWIKISAPNRNSRLAPLYPDLKPIVRALLDANPDRVLYGSDWPHTQPWEFRTGDDPLKPEPFMEVDDESWIKSFKSWVSEDEWHRIMVDNPRKLFDYDPKRTGTP
ncbi:hypothetical protein I317_07709 [Kwoniella heveanensis CBS 569]|uniref:Amidohydrolase-related domain-containing protein n=1 Tax=Kwoniella heveanensis BCC8398 TaxID=1296120 RepID=A0A1B9GK48_9TREE|nr:hypothetical protein I316_06836 [Kwoniella heveanensis BCC8398]OCF38528.1 hypothetical protein I317_07709 [Kwoniella heveanensis CBS 569]